MVSIISYTLKKKNLVKTKGHRMAMVLQKKFQPIELKLAGNHHKPAIQILFKKMNILLPAYMCQLISSVGEQKPKAN